MSILKSLTPIKMLTVGLFTVICHATGILLYFNINPQDLPPISLTMYAVGMLEYTLMTLLAVVVGAFLLDLMLKSDNGE